MSARLALFLVLSFTAFQACATAPVAESPSVAPASPVADSVLAWANRVRADSGAPPS